MEVYEWVGEPNYVEGVSGNEALFLNNNYIKIENNFYNVLDDDFTLFFKLNLNIKTDLDVSQFVLFNLSSDLENSDDNIFMMGAIIKYKDVIYYYQVVGDKNNKAESVNDISARYNENPEIIMVLDNANGSLNCYFENTFNSIAEDYKSKVTGSPSKFMVFGQNNINLIDESAIDEENNYFMVDDIRFFDRILNEYERKCFLGEAYGVKIEEDSDIDYTQFLAFYKFENDVNDYSGNENNAILLQDAKFDGESVYLENEKTIQFPEVIFDNLKNYKIEISFDIKTTIPGSSDYYDGNQRIFGVGNLGEEGHFTLKLDKNGQPMIIHRLYSGQDDEYIRVGGDVPNITDGEWHTIKVIIDKDYQNTISIYNGINLYTVYQEPLDNELIEGNLYAGYVDNDEDLGQFTGNLKNFSFKLLN